MPSDGTGLQASGRLAEKRFFDNLTAYDDGNGTPAEVTTYAYDAFGRQIEVIQDGDGDLQTTADQRVTDNTYDDLGHLVAVASPQGVVHYVFDDLGHHTATWSAADTATVQAAATTETLYSYDTLGQLDSVTQDRREGQAITPEVTDYVYDLIGNLDQVRLSGGVVSDYDYDSLNRLELLREFRDDGDFVWESGVDTAG